MEALKYHTRALAQGNLKLFKFYFKYFVTPFKTLPVELYNQNAMKRKSVEKKPFKLTVPGEYVETYLKDIKQLRTEIDDLAPAAEHRIEHKLKQVIFWIVRLVTIYFAFQGNIETTFLSSLVQFLFLPYSLFVALAYGAETIFVLYTGHILVFPLLHFICNHLLPEALNPTVNISYSHLVLFLFADQLLCTACLFKTPKGKTAPLSTKRILESVFYGFLNCKTYYLVLFPLCIGLQVPILPWVLDAYFGISSAITARTMAYWEVLFYTVHQMGHIRHVYPDAHKFHHYLHDCTAFDAHIFGSGAPEEWLILMCDVVLATQLGTLPASLSFNVLGVSWYNKWGFHTRAERPEHNEDNFHADHHTFHIVNIGFSGPYDLLMKTTPHELANKVVHDGYVIKREEDGENINLVFTPVAAH